MEIIVSADNNQIKCVCKLKDKKYRRETGKFIIEGYRNVKDSLPYISGSKFFMSESAFNKFGNEFADAVVCSDKVFAKISETDNSQGVIAVADIVEKTIDVNKNCVLLDRVCDPGNMGAIFRSCLATGFDNVINLSGVDSYNPKVVRSAMSAICKLNLIEKDDERVVDNLKGMGYKIICADMGGENLFEVPVNDEKICLVIGNEANGISDGIMQRADKTVSLPMGRIESLNAAICASVIMYQLKYNK